MKKKCCFIELLWIFIIINVVYAQQSDSLKPSYYVIRANKLDISAVDSFPQKIKRNLSNQNSYEIEIESHSTNFPSERFELIKRQRYCKDHNYVGLTVEYLKPTELIECNSPEISHISDSLRENVIYTFDFIKSALKFVSSYVKYDGKLAKQISDGSNNTQSALVTLHSKKGTCSEYTNLFLAILRNAGIPGRFVIGKILLPEGNQMYHAWAECYIANVGWMPVEVQNGNTWIPDWGIKLFAGKDFNDCNTTLPEIRANIEKIF